MVSRTVRYVLLAAPPFRVLRHAQIASLANTKTPWYLTVHHVLSEQLLLLVLAHAQILPILAITGILLPAAHCAP